MLFAIMEEKLSCANPRWRREKKTAQEVMKKTGATFLHPYNQEEVYLGQGTACIELIHEVSDVEIVIAPVGGGGLLAGTAIACHHFAPEAIVYGAEPANVDDAKRSFDSGRIEKNNTSVTIADGLRTTLGTLTFPIIKELVSRHFGRFRK
jgi:threonine dehydratase